MGHLSSTVGIGGLLDGGKSTTALDGIDLKTFQLLPIAGGIPHWASQATGLIAL